MGCDIHLFAEVKIQGKWRHYGELSMSRNYEVFSRMAHCNRGEYAGCLVPENRGLPQDADFMTYFRAHAWGEDGHSHSWLSRDEIKRLIELEGVWADPSDSDEENLFHGRTYFFGNGWVPSDSELRRLKIEDLRWVFWFDN